MVISEKLIQLRVENDVKNEADKIFKSQGLTTQSAIKIFLTQVANTRDHHLIIYLKKDDAQVIA